MNHKARYVDFNIFLFITIEANTDFEDYCIDFIYLCAINFFHRLPLSSDYGFL